MLHCEGMCDRWTQKIYLWINANQCISSIVEFFFQRDDNTLEAILWLFLDIFSDLSQKEKKLMCIEKFHLINYLTICFWYQVSCNTFSFHLRTVQAYAPFQYLCYPTQHLSRPVQRTEQAGNCKISQYRHAKWFISQTHKVVILAKHGGRWSIQRLLSK